MNKFFAGLALAAATWVISGAAATKQNPSMSDVFHVSNARGPIRPAGLAPLRGDVASEILAGPTNGLDSALLLPEPPKGTPLGAGVEIQRPPGQPGK